jgi:hypothetical protein
MEHSLVCGIRQRGNPFVDPTWRLSARKTVRQDNVRQFMGERREMAVGAYKKVESARRDASGLELDQTRPGSLTSVSANCLNVRGTCPVQHNLTSRLPSNFVPRGKPAASKFTPEPFATLQHFLGRRSTRI